MRGYDSPSEHAEDLKKRINDKVGANDYLYYLGDLALNATDEQVMEWLSGINCQNISKLWGNHSSNTSRIYRQEVEKQYGLKDVEVYPLRINNVVYVGNHHSIRVGKQLIVMNHFPLRIHNQYESLSWNLNGHSHMMDIERRPEHPLGKCLDIGIDYNMQVWSYQEIEEIMSTKELVVHDHRR